MELTLSCMSVHTHMAVGAGCLGQDRAVDEHVRQESWSPHGEMEGDWRLDCAKRIGRWVCQLRVSGDLRVLKGPLWPEVDIPGPAPKRSHDANSNADFFGIR